MPNTTPPPFARCCRACEDQELANDPFGWTKRLFVVCSVCGNKRCPKAQHHANECTGSNATGQKGGG